MYIAISLLTSSLPAAGSALTLVSPAAASPVAASQAAASPVAASPASAATAVPSFGHVFVIVGENKSLFQITSSNAPYIMNTLKPESAWFTDYNDVARGSLADYVGLTSGQYASCETAGPCGQQNVPSIFSQLGDGGWRDWNESMPSNCYRTDAGSLTALNAYQAGHNPALWFAGLPCSTYDVPAGTTGPDDMSYFNNALAAGTVPAYNFITPNNCEDGHNSCNGANTVTEYDNFLKREIPLIEASPAFGPDSVIFVTFDEGDRKTYDTNTMMMVLGPQVQPGTYAGNYDHYSTLATVEQGLGLPCLSNACTAGILPAFGSVPSPSVSITQPANGSTVSGTVTVAGTAAAQGSATISQVQVSVDGGTAQTAAGTASWSASIDTAQLTNGTHTITATATDSSNLSASATITVNVSNPVTAACPAVPPGATEYSGNVSVESGQTGWTGIYNSNSAVTRVEPAGGSYDGLWALQIGIKSGYGQGGVSNAKPIWVTSTTAGTMYTAGSFVKASATGETLSVTLTEKTPGGTTVGYHTTSLTLNDTNWHQVSDSYTAHNSGDILHYSVHGHLASTSQSFLADCLSLQVP
jgi:hypothetical protein